MFPDFEQSGEYIIIDKKTGKAKIRRKNTNGIVIEVEADESYDLKTRRSTLVDKSPVRRQSETKAQLLEREREIEELNKDREKI